MKNCFAVLKNILTEVSFFIQKEVRICHERGHIKIFVHNVKIFSCNYDNGNYAKLFFKNRNKKHNKKNFSFETSDKKSILFIVKSLELNGGMENRLFQYAAQLKKEGIEPYFLCQYNEYPPIIKNFVVFRLYFNDADFQENLISLIKYKKINVIEFQFGGTDYFENLDILEIKKLCRIGITIHNFINAPLEKFSHLDYKFTCFNTSLDYIPNGVYVDKNAWSFSRQKKAVLISRLSKEKLPAIESFIAFCHEHSIQIDIGAPLKNSESLAIKEQLSSTYKDISFLGNIDTISFLKKHTNDYLFVSGVGQVALEGLSLGYPVFVCSHYGLKHSTFVSNDNFDILQKNNFVIKAIAGKLSICQSLPNKSYTPISCELLNNISFEKIYNTYKEKIKI